MNDSTNPDPTGIGAKLDEHYYAKLRECEAKYGKKVAKQLSTIAQSVIGALGQINASREQVRFVQEWIDEVGEILEPQNRIILPDAD